MTYRDREDEAEILRRRVDRIPNPIYSTKTCSSRVARSEWSVFGVVEINRFLASLKRLPVRRSFFGREGVLQQVAEAERANY